MEQPRCVPIAAGRDTFLYRLIFLPMIIPAKNRVERPGFANAAHCVTEKVVSPETIRPHDL